MFGVYEGCIILLKPANGRAVEHHMVAFVGGLDDWGLPIVLANGERFYLFEWTGKGKSQYGNGWHVAETAEFDSMGALDGGQMPFKVLV